MSQLVRQLPQPLLVADVLLPLGAILGAAGHHDFQRLRFPLGPQLDERVVEVQADAAAHADNRSEAKMASHTDFNSTLAIIALPSIASTRFSSRTQQRTE